MKKYSVTILMLLLWLLVGYSTASAAPGRVFENRQLGIRVEFPAQWDFYTGSGAAPEFLKDAYQAMPRERKALYVAGHADQQAFGRLTSEAFAGSPSDYFSLLYAMEKDKVEVVRAQYDALNDVVQWEFRVKTAILDLTFFETISTCRGQVVRIGFWTFSPLFEKYRPAFEAITEKTALLLENGRWAPRWTGLRGHLEGSTIEYVSLARPEAKQAGPACANAPQNLLWSVRGSRGTVHLFASIHLGRPEFYPLAPAVESAFAGSGTLVVELDATSEDVKKKMAAYMGTAKLPKGTTVKDVVSPGVYRNLVTTMDTIGLPLSVVSGLKPTMIALMLSVLKFQSLGYTPDFGVDQYFLERAAKDKQIVELEGFEEQIRLFDEIGGEEFLAYTLLSLNTMDREAEKLVTAWRCGDIRTLKTILFEGLSADLLMNVSDVYEKLFFARNRKMADRIRTLLQKDGTYFVVVGAGHLVGDRSIPDLLRAGGFEVSGP